MQVFDPRNTSGVLKVKCHVGPKMAKAVWIDDETILTSGTDQTAQREFAVWDARKLDKKVTGGSFPSGVGVTHLTCDHDHKIVYCNFRGELNTGLYQYNVKAPSHMIFMSNYQTQAPVKCFSGMPKWICDPSTHEVMRFAKCDN